MQRIKANPHPVLAFIKNSLSFCLLQDKSLKDEIFIKMGTIKHTHTMLIGMLLLCGLGCLVPSTAHAGPAPFYTETQLLPNGHIMFKNPVQSPTGYPVYYEMEYEQETRFYPRTVYEKNGYGLITRIFSYNYLNQLLYVAHYNIRGDLSSYYRKFYDDQDLITHEELRSSTDELQFKIVPEYSHYGQLIRQTYYTADEIEYLQIAFQWDNAHNLTEWRLENQTFLDAVRFTMDYDELSRLTLKQIWTESNQVLFAWEYDYPDLNEVTIIGSKPGMDEPIYMVSLKKDEYGRIQDIYYHHNRQNAWLGPPALHIDYNTHGFPAAMHLVNTMGTVYSKRFWYNYTGQVTRVADDGISPNRMQVEEWYRKAFESQPKPYPDMHAYMEDLSTLPFDALMRFDFEWHGH